MYEFTCAYCGKTVQVEREWQVRTYCSLQCSAKGREIHRKEIREKVIEGECIYQPESIMCDRRNCSQCGWNPEVAKARLERICECNAEQKPKTKVYCDEWISVDTRLPENGVQVLTFTHAGKVLSLHCKDGKWCTPRNVVVTHWMPMPKAPKV